MTITRSEITSIEAIVFRSERIAGADYMSDAMTEEVKRLAILGALVRAYLSYRDQDPAVVAERCANNICAEPGLMPLADLFRAIATHLREESR